MEVEHPTRRPGSKLEYPATLEGLSRTKPENKGVISSSPLVSVAVMLMCALVELISLLEQLVAILTGRTWCFVVLVGNLIIVFWVRQDHLLDPLPDFDAIENKAHLVRAHHSPVVSLLKREYITKSTLDLEDLQQNCGGRRDDAPKSFGEQQAFDATNNRAHVVKANESGPTRSNSEKESTREALTRYCLTNAISLEDLRPNFSARAARRKDAANSGLCDSLAWKSFKVLDILPLGEQSNKFKHLAQRRALTHKHCVQLKKSQDLPRSLRRDCGLAAQSAISLPDGRHILSLSEKKIMRKTFKRECRPMSALSLEDHQQHVGRRREDAAKFLGAKRICRQLVIHHESTGKRIRRQHGTRRWPFKQNWVTLKGYSLRGEILVGVMSLPVDEKLFSRLQRIHISWLGRFSPRPSALPGGENVGSIVLSSSEFAATNGALRGGQDQSGSTASHSGKKRPREQEDEEINTHIGLNDLRRCYGMKREDATKKLGVWRPPDPRGENNLSPTRERLLTNGQIEIENYPATSPPTSGSLDDYWRNIYASVEKHLFEGHVCESNYHTVPPFSESQAKPTSPHPMPTRCVKATYEDTIIKFQLPDMSGINELKEEVSKTLQRKVGDLYIEYEDGDEELILMASDYNVREYLDLVASKGNQVKKLRVRGKVH